MALNALVGPFLSQPKKVWDWKG